MAASVLASQSPELRCEEYQAVPAGTSSVDSSVMRHSRVSPGGSPLPKYVFSLVTVAPGYAGKPEGRQLKPPRWKLVNSDARPSAPAITATITSTAQPPTSHQIQRVGRRVVATWPVGTHCVPSHRQRPSGEICPVEVGGPALAMPSLLPGGLEAARDGASTNALGAHRHDVAARHVPDPRLELRVAARQDVGVVDPAAREHVERLLGARERRGVVDDQGSSCPVGRTVGRGWAMEREGLHGRARPAENVDLAEGSVLAH